MVLSKVTSFKIFIMQDKMNQVTMVYIVAGEATQFYLEGLTDLPMVP